MVEEAVRPRIYVASALGFSEPGRHYYRAELLPALANLGYDILDPWAMGESVMKSALQSRARNRGKLLVDANRRVGKENARMIESCAAMFAILDGPDVDSGTAAEIGFAAALGKPVVGVRTDLRVSGDNEVAEINLQVRYFIERSQGSIVRSLEAGLQELGRVTRVASAR